MPTYLWPGREGSCFLVGMIHLGPILQSSDPFDLEKVEATAIRDALVLAEAGFDALIVENFGDTPFYPKDVPPQTIAGMTRIISSIQRAILSTSSSPPLLGVNVLRNDAHAALAIAAATNASFIRVNVHTGAMLTDQGLLQGEAHLTCRFRDQIHPTCAIFADVQVKHAAPLAPRPLEEEAADTWLRGRADALILTGSHTGGVTDPSKLHRLRKTLPDARLLVGSGVAPEQIPILLPLIDGLIVGSWLKEGGRIDRPVDPQRARRLVSEIRLSA